MSSTNHIHADDLAAIMVRALRLARPQRVINASDDSCMKMADYFDCVADAFSLPRPPRVTREQAEALLPATQLSFMDESRRLCNRRLKRELGYALIYADIEDFLCGRGKARGSPFIERAF